MVWCSAKAVDLPRGNRRADLAVGKTSLSDVWLGIPELSPQSFSFNTPLGMCPDCTGLGTRLEMDPQLVIPDTRKSIRRRRD